MEKQERLEVQRRRRRGHVRRLIRGTQARPRLTVFRSGRHILAQVIDDSTGRTLVSASTQQKEVREGLKSTADRQAAKKVGATVATRAKEAGIEAVCFDRGHYRYHGRIAALADGAREAGLKF